MPDIVLASLNAKYIHASFGLRYLMANLGELRDRACMAEFVINQQPLEIVEAILAKEPLIVGFGVYIWNVEQTTEVVALLKRIRPELAVILGGPEVSYETEGQEIVALADHVITGEADVKFAEVCRGLLNDEARMTNDETGAEEVSASSFGRRPQKPCHLRRGLAWLPVHLRVLFVVARHSRPRLCHGGVFGVDAAAVGSRSHAVQVCGPHLQSASAHEHGHFAVLPRPLA
jgi:radical SAM superfamily enzyme YgiQ (UPF0313 family)